MERDITFTEENKASVRRFFDAFQTNDQVALKELLAPDLVAHLPGDPGPLNREAFLEVVGRWNAAFSDLRFTVEDQIAEGGTVATRATLRGVHSRADFAGVQPTGKQIEVNLVTIEHLAAGRIVERWVTLDILSLMQQLGAAPTHG